MLICLSLVFCEFNKKNVKLSQQYIIRPYNILIYLYIYNLLELATFFFFFNWYYSPDGGAKPTPQLYVLRL